MTINDLFLIAGMALVTFATRYPILALVSKVDLPPSLLSALKFIPPAVLTAIILPTLLSPAGNSLDISYHNTHLVAGLITIIVAWRTHNILVTLAIGMAAFWGWRLLLPWLLAM